MRYRKEINIPSLLFTSLSCMIGSGWLLGSYQTLLIAGPSAIVAWLIGALMIITIAFCFSELSTALPFSGGIARYSLLSHGKSFSFIMSWLAWISEVAVAPTEVHTILRYISPHYPVLTHPAENGDILLSAVGLFIAFILLLLMVLINKAGIRLLVKYNNVFAIWKVLIPSLICVALFSQSMHIENISKTVFMPRGWHGVFEAISSTVVFSYLGFREATSLASEVKNPQRAIPIAVIGAVIFCCVFYILIQVTFICSINPVHINNDWSHIQIMPEAPWSDLALMLGLVWISSLISADACINPFGAGLIYTTTSSRVSYAMAQSGVFPQQLARLTGAGVPVPALFFNLVVGMLLFYPLPSWYELVKFQATAVVMAYAVGPISLIVLRDNLPDLNRPFRLYSPLIFCTLTLFVCNLITYWTGWHTIRYLMLSIVFGFSFFSLLHYQLNKTGVPDMKHIIWLVPHFLGITVISYLGDFDGGQSALPPFVDYLLLLASTLISMTLARRQSVSSAWSKRTLLAIQQLKDEA